VLPFALEMLALRRMAPTAFGTLMALEPALGVLLGLLILHQQPSIFQVLGILNGLPASAGGRAPGAATWAPTAFIRIPIKELERCSLA
jgi:inner membrane transporter RhtA